MSTRKHRPVLYEVVRRSRLNAGGEVRRVVGAAGVARPAPPITPPTDAVQDGVAGAAPELVAADPAPDYGQVRSEATLPLGSSAFPSWTAWLTEGRLHLSVGWLGASVAGVALVLVLFVTFQAGMRFASPATPAPRENPAKPDTAAAPARSSERQTPPRQAADLSVLTPPRAAPTTPDTPAAAPRSPTVRSAPPPVQPTTPAVADAADASNVENSAAPLISDAVEFESGSYYLVIQHFHRDQSDAAKQAQEFLKSSGIDCALRVGSKDIRLLATRAFRLSGGDAAARKTERTALDEMKRRVKELGKEYTRTRARGYAFDQCYELKQ